jgi:hypothetical protein
MQGQLEVCDLDECDFLECGFQEYFDDVDFEEDWNDSKSMSSDNTEKGIIVVLSDNQDGLKYIYSEVGDTQLNLAKWLKDHEVNLDKRTYTIVYYKLKVYKLQKVYRDTIFFNEKIQLLKGIWDNILKYRSDRASYDAEIGKKCIKKRPIKCLFINDDL